MKRKAFLQTACTLTAVLLLAAACTQDELSGGKGETLPEGKYPMTFATTVEGVTATRATTDNSWAGGEDVAVQVRTANPKRYTAATDGKLSAATNETPFYWESTSDIDVSAWYPYSATKPTSFSVKKDQSGTDGTDGYQASDLIYAAS
ncbi:fimbrillin family protein, partial [uncultured Bacteroides sp.]|uniref:fimbrillin family protein n=1 Tax=uncultured Bacteroides sp. TaxID=162156 RepID=UPI0025F19123